MGGASVSEPGVGPPPSFVEQHWKHGLILAVVVAFVLIGLTILSYIEHWFG